MQISASALFFGLITGLLAVWLFLFSTERQHADYRVTESRVACDKARFDSDFSANFGKPSKTALEREKVACAEFDAQSGLRVLQEEKARKEADELKQSIEKALTSDQTQAAKQEAEAKAKAQAAASAVAATGNTVAREIKK